jgi:aryl-alcohol dehydrogenase-like predicted oxidoreductase
VRKRPLGKTGLVVSELALGTWGLSGDGYGKVEEADAERVVRRALELGFDLIETSDAYGAGRMEALLGRVLAGRSDVRVIGKVGTDRTMEPARKRFDREWIVGSAERSLKRLKREALDVYLLHGPSPDAVAVGEATSAMEELKKAGKILHWGVAAGDLDVARIAIDKNAEVLSMPYNLFHQVDVHRISGDVMVSRVGLLAHSVLSYGLFSGTWTKDREFSQGDHRMDRWTRLELERRVGQLDAVRHLVRGEVLTLRGAAVRFALANHVVSAALLGPRTVEQLDQLVRETGGGPRYLPDEDLASLHRTLQRAGIPT